MKKVYTILATALLATLFSGQVIGQVTFFPNPSMTGSFSISPTATELQRTATIKIWGAGGNGANGPSSNSGGGGGAGGYYQSKEIVLPAGTYTYVVGIGGQLSGQNQNITKLVFPGTAGEIIVYSGANA
ncbi:MAG: hypothetical protein RL750_713, partial [Bacteroidota bacterium]